uniref:Lysm-containing receptor kinase 12 n=1 Tax=Parasponia rigida TaxID=3477 RepID=A0A221I0U6_PARRI|nr:lysm-containing receptor kinase 12 [Parasponia rigida]
MAAAQISSKLYSKAFVLFMCLIVSTLGQSILSCENTTNTSSQDISGFHCTSSKNGSLNRCGTFAILRTNSYFSSLSNLSFYLGINRFVVAEANGISPETEFLPRDQPLLIPIDCQCDVGLFQARLAKTTLKGESFSGIAESLEGLTTCKAIKDKNPGVPPWNLGNKVSLLIPLPCACPSSEVGSTSNLLVTYPVTPGDTISNLAIKFNTTKEAIISANNRSFGAFRPEESLTPFTSLVVPVSSKPVFGALAKPREPNLRLPATSIPVISPHKKKSKMGRIGLYIALSGIFVGVSIAVAAAFLVIKVKKKQSLLCKGSGDMELQQLSLSVRTISDKKVSFEGSNQDPLDGQTVASTTPRKAHVETYTVEELKKATEDFSSSNQIEGSVYHGRLNGKNLAIKHIRQDIISKIEFGLFKGAIHHRPNIISLVGTCLTEEGPDSYLVFEYAKNGSLKDWLHGGLAMKNQFIASCYCFLTWSQRLKICLDVAMALQYMHHRMDPCYVHRNVKSRNIFVDEEFNAKIGNFGMAKCVEDDTADPQICSTNPATWSLGYLAPEYIHQGVISPSMDIFAYGVVLLEVLSGQTPISRPNEKGGCTILLSEKVKFILESENAEELREWMDVALGENYSFDAAVTLANLARACIEEDPALRPTAEEVVEKLSRLVEEAPQGECSLISQSSSKSLVKAAATNM